MDIDVAEQARGHDTVQPDQPFRRVPWNGTRINRAGRHSRPRRDEKFRGCELIELTDDAVTGGSRQTDGGDQRRHADHDAKYRQRHTGRTRDRPGDGLGDEVAHRDPRRRDARPGWRWQCRLAPTKELAILHVDPARAPARDVFVVRNDDDRHALLVELGEEIQDRLGVLGIEIAGRLVAQEQAR